MLDSKPLSLTNLMGEKQPLLKKQITTPYKFNNFNYDFVGEKRRPCFSQTLTNFVKIAIFSTVFQFTILSDSCLLVLSTKNSIIYNLRKHAFFYLGVA